jgi:hypothetical protein
VTEFSIVTEDETLQLVRDTYPTLDRWRELGASNVVITHGSELQLQDVEWPYVPSTTVALVGLVTAREHLHAIRLLIAARELFPSATATLGRAALIGAAQTVWMLAPDDHDERIRRSASLVREDYRHHLNYGEFAVAADTVEMHPTADEQLERLNERYNSVTALAERYGGASRINMTDDVLPAALAATTSEREFQQQVQLRWRQMSGSAHSLLWPHYGHAGTTTDSVDSSGIGYTVDGGDVDRLGMDYFSAYHVAACGWRLFGQRGGRPDLAS